MSRWSVSALFGERVRVELRPASLRLARPAEYPGSRRLDQTIQIEAPEGSSEYPREPWRASLDALAAALRDQRGALGGVEVILSDHFVRYLLVPWSESVVSDSDRLALARLSFRDVYGHLADAWDLSVDLQPAGEASFACAVDRALLSGLRDVVSRAAGRLECVKPALADCLNRHRRMLKEQEFCLATAEPGRISLAFRARTGWQAVRSRRSEGSLTEALPTLLKQEAVASSAPDGGVLYLCAANTIELPSLAVQGWRLIRLAEQRHEVRSASSPGFAAERIDPRPNLMRE